MGDQPTRLRVVLLPRARRQPVWDDAGESPATLNRLQQWRDYEISTTAVRRIDRIGQSIAPFMAFFTGPFAKLNANPEVANFAVGNPQDFPMPEYVRALATHLEPRRRDWFAYKDSEPKSRIAVARGLSQRTGMKWDPASYTNSALSSGGVPTRSNIGFWDGSKGNRGS